MRESRYRRLKKDEQNRLWSEQLNLFLGVHQGVLRFFTADGKLVPTPQEEAELQRQQKELERQQKELAEQRAERESQQKEIAEQRAEKLAAKLRELNIDPETL